LPNIVGINLSELGSQFEECVVKEVGQPTNMQQQVEFEPVFVYVPAK